MATINLLGETGATPPPTFNALERQVQTLVTTVKRFTQRNQELKKQLNQRNEQRPKDQHDRQDNEEQNGNQLLAGKGGSGRKQHPQQERRVGRHRPTVGTGKYRNAHGIGHADNEGKDGHDNERHEGTSIHQPG